MITSRLPGRRRGRVLYRQTGHHGYDPQMTSQLAVHRASVADTERVTEIITLAFAHDPLWAHAMARPDGGTAHHAEFWRLFVEGALRYPDTWLTSGGEATSIWIPPGGTEMTPEQEQQLADLATDRLGPAAGDYLELVSRFDAAHLPAYLESTNPANNRRYASVGFEPHGEFCYPGGGPVVTTMWRPAR